MNTNRDEAGTGAPEPVASHEGAEKGQERAEVYSLVVLILMLALLVAVVLLSIEVRQASEECRELVERIAHQRGAR